MAIEDTVIISIANVSISAGPPLAVLAPTPSIAVLVATAAGLGTILRLSR